MYTVRILHNKKLVNVLLYHEYESALSDIINGSKRLFSNIPESNIGAIKFECPTIIAGSTDSNGHGTDFEFRYLNGVTAHIGEPIFEDESV